MSLERNIMLKIEEILHPLYKYYYKKIDINISTMIYIIKKRAYILGIKQYELIQTSQILDLYTAMSILQDEVYHVNYYLYREVNKCLRLIDDFFEIDYSKRTQKCQNQANSRVLLR